MRVGQYLFIMVGIMIMFNLFGITGIAGKILTELDVVTHPEDISLTTFFITSIGILGGIFIGGSIIASLYTSSSPESFLLVGYASMLLYFIADIITIVSQISGAYPDSWVKYVIIAICMPVAIGYYHAVISWWGGKSG